MKQRALIVALTLLWLAVACRPAPIQPIPTPAAAATATVEVAETSIAPTTAVTATMAPTAGGRPPLFDVEWDDRAVYAAGLVDAAADDVPGAPVYHIDIDIDPGLSSLTGRQTVFYTNLEDTALEEIYFHLHPNLLDSAITVGGILVDGAPVTPEISGEGRSILRIPLPQPLAKGETTTLDMAFQVDVATEIGRNYGVLAFYEDILALPHFYPMLSVYDETGWNTTEADVKGDLTYSDAAYFLVRATAPADVVLVGSGAVVEESAGGETRTITYAVGPARDFYLAAGDFAVVSKTVGETTINSYAPAELMEGAELALDVAAAALTLQSERLGPFPYTELDIVTTPTSALGIEYPGLIVGTVRMYDVGATTAGGIPMDIILESTTAHEVSHQWFYNLVGNDQLDEPWLDESVTSYSTYRYYVDRYGQQAADSFFQNFYDRWDRVDRATIPIGLPVADYTDEEYSPIVYGRGPIFVRELEEMIGRETFDAFLRDYATRFRWEIPTAVDFRALAEEHCGCDLGALFSKWVYE